MGKIIPVIITQFDGGLSEDKRSGWVGGKDGFTTNRFGLTKHFDAFTYPHKLVPYNKTQACDNEQKSYKIVKFLYANGKFYGLGEPTGAPTNRLQVYENSGFLVTDSWGTSTNGTGTTQNENKDVFFSYYSKTDAKTYIYMLTGGVYLSRFDTSGGAFADSHLGLPYTTTQTQAQPVHHPSDDCAYFFGDNIVYRLNDNAWDGGTGVVLTLPANIRIVSVCPHGNYLAIGCITTDSYNTRSIAYLWDRDSSLATLTERIDFGLGILRHLASLDNKLIAVIDGQSENPPFRVYIKQASGYTAVILNELVGDALNGHTPAMPATNFVKDNVLYFPMGVKLNGDDRFGIWAVNSLGRVTLAIVEEDVTATQSIEGIYATNDIWWIAHSADGSVNRSSYSDNQYSATSIYESLIFNGGDSSMKKKLVGASAMYEPLLVAGATVVLKYRKDEETAWTQIFSKTNDVGSVSHSAINIESSGVNLPEYKEIQFRIESTGGTVITGLKLKVEMEDKDIY